MWKGRRPWDDPLIQDIATKYGKTPSQVSNSDLKVVINKAAFSSS